MKLVRQQCRFGPYALLARHGGAWLGVHGDAPHRLVHLDIAPKATVGTMFHDAEEWLRQHARHPMPTFLEAGVVETEAYLARRHFGGVAMLDVARAVRDEGLEPATETALAEALAIAELFLALPPGPTGQALIEERRVFFRWNGEAWLDVPTPFELTRAGRAAPLTSFAQMPPEQLRGTPLDARGNVYRFATQLVRTWTGRSVLDSAPDQEVIERVKAGRLDPIKLPEHFPATMLDLLDWCLATDPKLRPGSIDEVKAVLEDLAQALDVGPHAIAGYIREVFADECATASAVGDDVAALTAEAVGAWPTFAQMIDAESAPSRPGAPRRVPTWWNKILKR